MSPELKRPMSEMPYFIDSDAVDTHAEGEAGDFCGVVERLVGQLECGADP